MSVAETSKAAYHAVEYKLVGNRLKVFDTISEMGTASNDDVARRLGWEINRVTGRVNELVKMGKLVVDSIQPGRYGHSVKVWRPKELKQSSFLPEMDCAV